MRYVQLNYCHRELGVKQISAVLRGKTLVSFLCHCFNVKMASGSDQTAPLSAPSLISLAGAIVCSTLFFLFFCVFSEQLETLTSLSHTSCFFICKGSSLAIESNEIFRPIIKCCLLEAGKMDELDFLYFAYSIH